MTENPLPIFDTMVQFFTEDDWQFHQLEGKPILSMAFKGDNGSWMCYAQAKEEQHQFVFYSIMGSNVPADRRQAVAEFLTRANYGLTLQDQRGCRRRAVDHADGQDAGVRECADDGQVLARNYERDLRRNSPC